MENRTTIQISENLRKQLKILASYRDISYDEILEDLVNIFQNMIPFRDEREFSKWFEENLDKFGFKEIIERKSKGSPDYKLEDKNGDIKEVELEIVARDFERHKRDSKKTDIIVSVYSDTKEIKGVPILSIIEIPEDPKKIVNRFNDSCQIVTIPKPLAEKIKKRCEGTGFNTISDYITYVLRQVLSTVETRDKVEEPRESLTKEQEEKVKQGLKSLGYLD